MPTTRPGPPPPHEPVRRSVLTTRDGLDLRAEWREVPSPSAAAVVCHPHPLHGGTMHAPVVDALFHALPADDVTTLRFNFRGVQGSEGRFDHGRGERLDVEAALMALAERHPGIPIWLAGWSFGADVSLAVDGPAVAGWFAVAPPLALVGPEEMVAGRDDRPTLLVCPEHDQFRTPEAATAVTADWAATEVMTVPMADHFLLTGLDVVVDAARRRLGHG